MKYNTRYRYTQCMNCCDYMLLDYDCRFTGNPQANCKGYKSLDFFDFAEKQYYIEDSIAIETIRSSAVLTIKEIYTLDGDLYILSDSNSKPNKPIMVSDIEKIRLY